MVQKMSYFRVFRVNHNFDYFITKL